jgi:hypothetical protein
MTVHLQGLYVFYTVWIGGCLHAETTSYIQLNQIYHIVLFVIIFSHLWQISC